MSETSERPRILKGETHKVPTGCGNLYITINKDSDGKVFEIIAKLGKSGGCAASQIEALTRSISIGLRSGVELHEFHKTLNGISCPNVAFADGNKVSSCADAIARIISMYLVERME